MIQCHMRPLIQKLAVLPMLTIYWACLHYCWAPKKEEDHITTSSCPLGFYSEALRAHQCALFLTLIAVILALALSDFQLFMLCIVCRLKGRVMVWDTMKTHWNKWITIYLFHKNIRYDCILFLVVWSRWYSQKLFQSLLFQIFLIWDPIKLILKIKNRFFLLTKTLMLQCHCKPLS